MANMNKGQIIGIVTIIGALILAIATFLTWCELNGASLIGSSSTQYSGLDMASDDAFEDEGFQKYIPAIVLVLGIVAIILSVVEFFKPGIVNFGAFINCLLMLAGIILAVVFMTWDIFDIGLDLGIYSFSVDVGTGCYVAIAGAAIGFIGALLQVIPALKKSD